MAWMFSIEPNEFLKQKTTAFYSVDYVGWHQPNNPDFINDLKNTFDKENMVSLSSAIKELWGILDNDLPKIIKKLAYSNITICCIPRAKAKQTYSTNQLLFSSTIQKWVSQKNFLSVNLFDGTDYITRHTNTRTTHLSRNGFDQNGKLPYIGITKDTCTISPNVRGKNILLIDDIYTKSVNIDEDAIQALYDNGANNVAFYAVARTVRRF